MASFGVRRKGKIPCRERAERSTSRGGEGHWACGAEQESVSLWKHKDAGRLHVEVGGHQLKRGGGEVEPNDCERRYHHLHRVEVCNGARKGAERRGEQSSRRAIRRERQLANRKRQAREQGVGTGRRPISRQCVYADGEPSRLGCR